MNFKIGDRVVVKRKFQKKNFPYETATVVKVRHIDGIAEDNTIILVRFDNIEYAKVDIDEMNPEESFPDGLDSHFYRTEALMKSIDFHKLWKQLNV